MSRPRFSSRSKSNKKLNSKLSKWKDFANRKRKLKHKQQYTRNHSLYKIAKKKGLPIIGKPFFMLKLPYINSI